jgi:hypothetical protein
MHLATLISGRTVARKTIEVEPSLMELVERIAADKSCSVNTAIQTLLLRAVSSPELD